MATSANALDQFESGRTLTDFTAMTDSGDNTVHTLSGVTIFSGRSGYEPDIRPNGIVTGANLLSTHATEETVTVAGFTAYSQGVLKTVTATTAVVVRPTGAYAKIDSITMTSAGAIAVVEGTEAADAVFIATRGGDGGPPLIPVDSVEIGQVRMNTSASAVITESMIYQDIGTHQERFDYPVFETNNTGFGLLATVPAKKNAFVEMASALPDIHTGPIAKKIYAKVYSPTFVTLPRSKDFVPATESASVTSEEYYRVVVGSTSTSLSAGSLSLGMTDNVTDAIWSADGYVTTFKHFPDQNKTPYILTQGTVSITPANPKSAQNNATVTIAAERKSVRFDS